MAFNWNNIFNIKNIKTIIIIALVFLIIDGIWLRFIAGPMFGKMVNIIQKEPMKINIIGAIISYILLIIGTYKFGYLQIDKNNVLISILSNAVLFGLLSYGIFDATNLAIFKDYDIMTGIIDTLWGGVVTGLTTYITYKII